MSDHLTVPVQPRVESGDDDFAASPMRRRRPSKSKKARSPRSRRPVIEDYVPPPQPPPSQGQVVTSAQASRDSRTATRAASFFRSASPMAALQSAGRFLRSPSLNRLLQSVSPSTGSSSSSATTTSSPIAPLSLAPPPQPVEPLRFSEPVGPQAHNDFLEECLSVGPSEAMSPYVVVPRSLTMSFEDLMSPPPPECEVDPEVVAANARADRIGALYAASRADHLYPWYPGDVNHFHSVSATLEELREYMKVVEAARGGDILNESDPRAPFFELDWFTTSEGKDEDTLRATAIRMARLLLLYIEKWAADALRSDDENLTFSDPRLIEHHLATSIQDRDIYSRRSTSSGHETNAENEAHDVPPKKDFMFYWIDLLIAQQDHIPYINQTDLLLRLDPIGAACLRLSLLDSAQRIQGFTAHCFKLPPLSTGLSVSHLDSSHVSNILSKDFKTPLLSLATPLLPLLFAVHPLEAIAFCASCPITIKNAGPGQIDASSWLCGGSIGWRVVLSAIQHAAKDDQPLAKMTFEKFRGFSFGEKWAAYIHLVGLSFLDALWDERPELQQDKEFVAVFRWYAGTTETFFPILPSAGVLGAFSCAIATASTSASSAQIMTKTHFESAFSVEGSGLLRSLIRGHQSAVVESQVVVRPRRRGTVRRVGKWLKSTAWWAVSGFPSAATESPSSEDEKDTFAKWNQCATLVEYAVQDFARRWNLELTPDDQSDDLTLASPSHSTDYVLVGDPKMAAVLFGEPVAAPL